MENEKIQAILKDKEFLSQVLKMETPEEVQKAFKQKGIELSLEEIGIVGDLVNSMIAKNSTSLSEEDLEEIAGGEPNEDENLESYSFDFTSPDVSYEYCTKTYPSPQRSENTSRKNIALTDNQINALLGVGTVASLGILGLSAIGLGTVAVGGFKAVKWAGKKILGRR